MDVQVLIVGAGPAGATTAIHLARAGIKTMMISRHQGPANTPRAHIFNQRAMEVLRDIGLEDEVSRVASSASDMQHTSWLHSLAGEEYARLWSWGNKPSQKGEYEMVSPCVMSDLPQTYLEPILIQKARKLGVDCRFHTEFSGLSECANGVVATVRDRVTKKLYTVSSTYLVGADGGRSTVVESLGIPVIGKQLNTAFNVHIRTELKKYFLHRPGVLNWILNPDAPDWSAVGNFRMVRPWNEFVVSLHPREQAMSEFKPSEEDIIKRLRQMIGDQTVPIKILSTYQWIINNQVADSWQKGRVLCIGDAVHRHPPINGLGSNTCISDGFNVAWKIAFVLKGWADPSLLETLTTERKPIGDGIVRRANDGMLVHRRLWSLMGTSPDERSKTISVLESSTAEGFKLRQELNHIIEEIDDEVQALGIQMNQVYVGSKAIVVEPADTAPDFSKLDELKEVMVTTFPGCHLPHVWIAANGQSHRISTLDLAGKGNFTLFTGIGGSKWRTAAEEILRETGIKIKCYTIGFRCDFMDCYRDWSRLRGVEEAGAVLVRPDQFIAWRCKDLPDDPTAKLQNVLSQILGKI